MKRPRNKQPKRTPCPWGHEPVACPTYDFRRLSLYDPNFRKHVTLSADDKSLTVDFTNREVTSSLTSAILRQFFSLRFALPAGHLTPTIPNRVQYLRWVVSLLPVNAPRRPHALVDVGTGPSAIYPLLGARLYPFWRFVGTDVDADALSIARTLVDANGLADQVSLVQTDAAAPLLADAYWETSMPAGPSATLCNPPFFDEAPATDDARGVAAGTDGQLATKGGEVEFIKRMARDSVRHPHIGVFSSLVGLRGDTGPVEKFLRGEEIRAYQVAVRQLQAGDRKVRYAVAWSFGPKSTRVHVGKGAVDAMWRVAISVSPGRRFANRMTAGGMIAQWREAMKALGWEEREQAAVGVTGGGETKKAGAEVAPKATGSVAETAEAPSLEAATSKSKIPAGDTDASKPVGDTQVDESLAAASDLLTKQRKDADSTPEKETGDGAGSAGEGVAGGGARTLMEKYVAKERRGKTVVGVSCAFDGETRRFNLLMKVEERGGLQGYEVYNVAKKVAAKMSDAMNEKAER